MSDNPFKQLLREFQAVYASYGASAFSLIGMTQEQVDTNRELLVGEFEVLGFVPLGKGDNGNTPGYWIFGPLRRVRFGKRAEHWEEPFKCFEESAGKAGAFLSLKDREQIPFPPAVPVAWWLSYMWWRKPPSEEDLLPPNDKPHDCSLIWSEPFLESSEMIEKYLLDDMPEGDTRPAARHSQDFSSVHWFGTDYTFTAMQADAVSEWWAAWKHGTPDVRDTTILTEVGAKSKKKASLHNILSGHPAWGTMIIAGATKGTHRLQQPEKIE